MRFRLEVSTLRKANGFRTFFATVQLFRRVWVQRWDEPGKPNWTWGIDPREI